MVCCFVATAAVAQNNGAQKRRLEPCACPVKVDSGFNTQCAYLIVPENRHKNNGKTIKLPFVVVKSNNPNKQQSPLLYSTGGPGGSSLGWAVGASRHNVVLDRDCIAFEQRGTQYAVPNLADWSSGFRDAIKEAYRKNLDKDSMMLVGTKRYKKDLEAAGIDISGYNTDETVADIGDLLVTLGIDSVNLTGGSYSGGLMLAVLQKFPGRVRALVLDSPLPTFVPIDEDEPANLNEALHILFQHVEQDSAGKTTYANLEARFKQYFTSIGNKKFYLRYAEKGKADSTNIEYTRADLLSVIEDNMGDPKNVPHVIVDLIQGRHSAYIKDKLDYIFQYGGGPNGMRISVYCADQTAYHKEQVLHELYNAYPYMQGYHINDVYKEMCDCWQNPPISPRTKQPFYSDKPILLGDGEMDYACRPLYIDMIHHYMPNSQRLLYKNGAHMVMGGRDWDAFIRGFLNHPYNKVVTGRDDVVAY